MPGREARAVLSSTAAELFEPLKQKRSGQRLSTRNPFPSTNARSGSFNKPAAPKDNASQSASSSLGWVPLWKVANARLHRNFLENPKMQPLIVDYVAKDSIRLNGRLHRYPRHRCIAGAFARDALRSGYPSDQPLRIFRDGTRVFAKDHTLGYWAGLNVKEPSRGGRPRFAPHKDYCSSSFLHQRRQAKLAHTELPSNHRNQRMGVGQADTLADDCCDV